MSDNISTKQRIFDAIAENRTISRIRLAEKYQIRLATITEVTRQLLDDGLILEAGEDTSSGGRKPTLLEINKNSFFSIGFFLSHNRLTCGLFNSGMEQKAEITEPTGPSLTGPQMLAMLKKSINAAIKSAGITATQITGIGIGLPAQVDIEHGIYNGASYYPRLKKVKIKEFLENEFHIPTIVDHDVVLMTMAEYYLSNRDVPENLGVLFIGRGIGCRFIIDGKIYRGVSNRASEFGHLPLLHDGPKCYCGNSGCFERLANTEAIEKAYARDMSFEEIVHAAANDVRALAVFHKTAGYIASAAANILNLMDVEMLIINGDIVIAKDLIADELHKQLELKRLNGRDLDPDKVVFSNIGQKVGILGPAIMASDRHFLTNGINIFPKRKF